jgi:hypothetical protein
MALDVGITEAFADDEGNLYGEWMGAVLKEASRQLDDKGRKRNKLHGLSKKYIRQGKKANRQGDRFQCLNCGYAGHADVIAAINQKARMNDREITLWTPKETVRMILVGRYETRLERRNALSSMAYAI